MVTSLPNVRRVIVDTEPESIVLSIWHSMGDAVLESPIFGVKCRCMKRISSLETNVKNGGTEIPMSRVQWNVEILE